MRQLRFTLACLPLYLQSQATLWLWGAPKAVAILPDNGCPWLCCFAANVHATWLPSVVSMLAHAA